MTETMNLAPAVDAILHGYNVPAYLGGLAALAAAVLLAACLEYRRRRWG
jgi:hypothetical protein